MTLKNRTVVKTSDVVSHFTVSERLPIVDAIRGFALVGIAFLHNLEHFHLFAPTDRNPVWLADIDTAVWKSFYFLFNGKAYEIFALLFGFSFWIQYENHKARGGEFVPRFAWRMVVLFGFGCLHGLFFGGDILSIYALMSGILIFTRKLPDRSILILAGLFLLQPVDLIRVMYSYFQPDFVYSGHFEQLLGRLHEKQMQGTFTDMVWLNATYGQLGNLVWNWENSRFFQTPALFLLGMYMARNKHFAVMQPKIWICTLAMSLIVTIPFQLSSIFSYPHIEREPLKELFTKLVEHYGHFPKMLLILSSLVLLWHYIPRMRSVLTILVPFGRMSLTNYISQSIIGTTLYMGYGFGLYRYCGGTLSICIALITLIIQITWSRWWLNRYAHGPLEYIWRRISLTMAIDYKFSRLSGKSGI